MTALRSTLLVLFVSCNLVCCLQLPAGFRSVDPDRVVEKYLNPRETDASMFSLFDSSFGAIPTVPTKNASEVAFLVMNFLMRLLGR